MRDYSFGNFLHELRKRRGLSQFQLGTLVGVSDKAVSKWENGSAKPQSHTLFKLADVLGVTVDELLACKYRSAKAENEKGVFAMKNKLWDNAYQKLYKRYGNNLPIEISNRYLSEATEFQQTDIIIYFDLLSKIRTVADNCNESIRIEGGLGASFIAFVLGATEINPLKPHYFCPNCRKIEFDKTARCGWDLPKKSCSCGCELLRDGHDLPFETVRPIIHKNMRITISVSKKFYPEVKETISNYFKENTVVTLTRNERQNLKTIVIVTDNISDVTNGQELSFNDYYERLKSFPSFMLIIDEEFDSLRLMAQETNTSIKDVDFTCKEVLEQFKNGFSDKRSDYCKERFGEFPYETFNERIQIAGLSHCNDLWLDHAKTAIKNGKSVNEIFAYRDDVFNYIQNKIIENSLSNTGYAYEVMNKAYRGVYGKDGVSDETQQQFKSLGIDEFVINNIDKIQYLFPKAHGITFVKGALIMMWYKINHPDVFEKYF